MHERGKTHDMWSLLRDFIHLKTAEPNSYQDQFLVADALGMYQFHECAQMFFARYVAEHSWLVAVKNAFEHTDLCFVLDVYDLAETCIPSKTRCFSSLSPRNKRFSL